MDGFDQLAITPAAADALARLRAATGGSDGPMERHCLRVRHIVAELAAAAIDRHHELRSQLARGPEVEAVPRHGLGGELAREVGRALRERPLRMPRIFLRPS